MTTAKQLASTLLSEETPKEFTSRHVVDWMNYLRRWGYVCDAKEGTSRFRKTYSFGSGRFVEIIVHRSRPLKLAWSIRFFGGGPIYRSIIYTSALQADKKAYEIDVFMHKHKRSGLTARNLRNLFDAEILSKT